MTWVFLQLITSTSSLDEIVRLLDAALGEMGLSASPRNCKFLLDALKAVSGRLALRLTQSGSVAQEMVALALTQSHCAAGGEEGAPWLSLKEGFFVPLDDVPELFRAVGESKDKDESGQRADLLYVTVGRRGGLKFSFVEVKFRRYLKTARALDLLEMVVQPTRCLLPTLGKVVRAGDRRRWKRPYSVPAWRGYCGSMRARDRRHTLTEEAFERIDKELTKLAREGTGYALADLAGTGAGQGGFRFLSGVWRGEAGGNRRRRLAVRTGAFARDPARRTGPSHR